MHVSRSPTARWTSAAATAESTPPDSAQMTLPSEPTSRACSSTRRRISATVDSMKLAGVHEGVMPATPTTKLRRTSRPCGVCATSGWNWMPYRLRGDVHESREWRRVGLRRGAEALRQRRDRVAVAHPHGLRPVEAREQAVLDADRDRRGPVLALRGRLDVAAELARHELGAVADARGPGCGRSRSPGPASGRRRRTPSSARRTGSRRPRRGAPAPRGTCRGGAAPSRRSARARGAR